MPLNHKLLLLLVAFIWGTNFVVMRMGLDEFPPFILAFLRYFFTLIPFAFFIKRPVVQFKYLFLAGVMAGGHFAFLFLALTQGMTPGVASLIIQSQVFITIFLSYLLFNEKITWKTACGIALAVCGFGIIFLHLETEITLTGVVLMLITALCWGVTNLTVKFAKKNTPDLDVLSFTIWSSLYAMLILIIFSIIFEGSDKILSAAINATAIGWGAAFWQALGNVVFGYGVWNIMLTRHSASKVTPFALLVPIFGMASSALILGEAFPLWKAVAGVLVMLGLAVALL